MTDSDTSGERKEQRFFDRIVALSDGVAAIAITLLVLPLLEIEAPDVAQGESAWDAIRDNSAAMMAFLITFVVIASLWFAHTRAFGHLARADAAIAWSNILYLLAIVSLPFASTWLQEDGFDGGVGTLYMVVLFAASASLALVTRHAVRHPELLTEQARTDPLLRVRRGYFYGSFFLVGVVVSFVVPAAAGWYLLALWPAGYLWGRHEDRVVAAAS